MRIKKNSLSLVLLVLCNEAFCQVIDSSIVARFQPSVLNRVIDICANQPIAVEKQKAIAEYFAKEDSLVNVVIRNGGSYNNIKEIRQQTLEQIKQKLLAREWQNYVDTWMVYGNVENYSRLMTGYYLKRYNLDSTKFTRVVYNHQKAQAMLLLPLASAYDVDQAAVKKAGDYYNSDIHKMMYELEGLKVFNELKGSLERIKPLNKNTGEHLELAFLNICRQKSNRSYREHFIDAVKSVVTDTIYYAKLFQDDIKETAGIEAAIELESLGKRFTLSKDAVKEIRVLVNNKKRINALYNLGFSKVKLMRDSLTNRNNFFYDSLISAAMFKDGNFEHTTLITTAIKNRKLLKLRASLTDTLINHTILLMSKWKEHQFINPWGRFDYAKFEAPDLDSLLTEEQYRQVLAIKNTFQAKEWAFNDWMELKQRGMDLGNDSALTIKKMTEFNTNLLVVKDRFASDKEKLNNELTVVYATTPPILQRLKRARAIATTDNSKSSQALKPEPLKTNIRW